MEISHGLWINIKFLIIPSARISMDEFNIKFLIIPQLIMNVN